MTGPKWAYLYIVVTFMSSTLVIKLMVLSIILDQAMTRTILE